MSGVLTEYRGLETRLLGALRADLSEAEFGALALEVFAFQRRWNEPFGRFCATKPGPRTWREIPAVPQGAFKRYRLSVAPDAVTKTFRTSGTTGEGFGEHHFIDTRLYDAAVSAGWRRLQLPQLPHLILIPQPDDAPHSSLAHMMHTLVPRSVEPLWFIARDGRLRADFSKALESVERSRQPAALLGTALAFLHAFEQFAGRRFRLPEGSFAMETGGYKGRGRDVPKPELYEMFGEYLAIAPDGVLNEYGMTELSSQFYTRGLGGVHEAGPWIRALVIDPETGREVACGETGILRLFDLANLGSVLAIETQDLAIRRARGFELLGRDPGALPRGCSRTADERMRG